MLLEFLHCEMRRQGANTYKVMNRKQINLDDLKPVALPDEWGEVD